MANMLKYDKYLGQTRINCYNNKLIYINAGY